MTQTDVLIIGGGLAGITAAWEIIRHSSLRVEVLCRGGGASPYIHGFCLPLGEGDSESLLYRDTLESGCGLSRTNLVRRLCRGSLELPRYFRELGLEIDADEKGYRLTTSLGSSAPRIATIRNAAGPALLHALREKLEVCSRYREHRSRQALSLVKSGERVTGAYCYDKESDSFHTVSAGIVILATGGFGRLFPESTNSPDIGGDGCAMAYLAGAKLTDMEFIQFEPSAAVWPRLLVGRSVSTTMFYEGAVLRNRDGERFMLQYGQTENVADGAGACAGGLHDGPIRWGGECVPKDVLSKRIALELRRGKGSPHGGVWFDATGVPQEKWGGVYRPYLDRYLACGIDLRREWVEIAPAAHTTCGGVLIDESCHTGVPGLLACGEVTGGLHGANRLGGNAGLETIVFGRTAGETAVREWPGDIAVREWDGAAPGDISEQGIPNPPSRLDVESMRRQLQKELQECMNVFRTGTRLEKGIQAMDRMLGQFPEGRKSYCEHRLYNDLITARMAMRAALERKESVGCHCREDAGDTGNADTMEDAKCCHEKPL